MAGNDQKTEQATPRRLEKARSEGNFPISAEVLGAITFVAALAIWMRSGEELWHGLAVGMRRGIAAAFRNDIELTAILRQALLPALPIAGLFAIAGGVVMASGLAVQLLQTGFRFAPAKLAPELSRLNPIPRITRMPEQNRHQLLRAVLLLPVVAWLVQSLIRDNWQMVLALPAMGLTGAATELYALARGALWRAAAVLVVISLIDLAQRRRRYTEDLKMSRQEIRDESKDTEGNQQAKANVRRMMRDLLRRRMMSEVPKATAVIVNPTHYAVAIRYVAGEGAAPKVVAKGKNYLAARIRQSAERHGVPVIENPPLARSLYRAAEVGQEIPAALYRAVAEVLAYVYRMTGGFERGR